MRILFAGDMFLGGDLLNQTEMPVHSEFYSDAEIRIANLEQPISDSVLNANKSTLHTNSSVIPMLKTLGISAVNLANNHIQDKGDEGIINTIHFLDQAGIAHFGAGNNSAEAKKPFWVTKDIAIFGYCDYGRSYLSKVQVAAENSPGVNPLRQESILQDLAGLPEGTKAILFFHWGREHVWLPPYEDIQLARRLLEHDKVIMILGAHTHRIQGCLEHKGKRACMSLGNFLFPNFFIQTPSHIYYPSVLPKKFPVTRQYHKVNGLTYKKWRLVNRISLLMMFDLETSTFLHRFVIQDDNVPKVSELTGLLEKTYRLWIFCLNLVYKLPASVYQILELFSSSISVGIWNTRIIFFYLLQNGVVWTLKYLLSKITSRGQ
jgi:hypothetical protein